ncbi:hypothetical protein AWZ03_000372 [Drosophila navojoa]|uniref:Uncharacterized protein n=1 Tax=Drosophila navojoa TaxID=7232 RepID=A0A484BXJ7_DRONA|nr:hypothetical protein AWZ03_000372 [Drosophila navojoa]
MWAQNYNAQLGHQEPLPYRTTVYLPIPDQSAVPHAMTTSVLSLPTMVPAQAFVVVTSPHGNHIHPYGQQEQLQQQQPMGSLEQTPPQEVQLLLTQTSDLKENQKNQSKKSFTKKLHRYGASPEMLKSGSAFPSYYADPQKLWHRYYLHE